MPVGNYSYQFFICCPRECVSRHNGGTLGAPIMPRQQMLERWEQMGYIDRLRYVSNFIALTFLMTVLINLNLSKLFHIYCDFSLNVFLCFFLSASSNFQKKHHHVYLIWILSVKSVQIWKPSFNDRFYETVWASSLSFKGCKE